MKTLIFNGSPKKSGDTAALLHELTRNLPGEVRIVSPENNIAPCLDCRHCWTNKGCCIQDDMQSIYLYLEECDLVVLASPVWYSALSGPLLNMASRLQPYFTARFFRHEPSPCKNKKGLILLVGGQPGTEEAPARSASIILQNVNIRKEDITCISSMNTDRLPAREDAQALEQIRLYIRQLHTL